MAGFDDGLGIHQRPRVVNESYCMKAAITAASATRVPRTR